MTTRVKTDHWEKPHSNFDGDARYFTRSGETGNGMTEIGVCTVTSCSSIRIFTELHQQELGPFYLQDRGS